MSISLFPRGWRNRYQRIKQSRWFRIAAWAGVSVIALVLLAAVALTILVNNPRFHNYLIRTVESSASESLGVRVQFQNFALNLPALSLDVYGITVNGASPYSNPPLIQIDHVAASVRVVSILHRAWYLDNLRIDRPIVHVFVDEHGVSNIPTIKSSGKSSNTTVFDLGIRHALLEQGEVYYNNKPSALAVDLRDLVFRSSFNNPTKKYSGHLEYAEGHLVYGTYRPLTHNLDAEFEATPSTFKLTRSKLVIGASQVLLNATLRNYANPSVKANYDVTVDGDQVASVLHNSSVPSGIIRASGSLQYQQIANVAVINAITINGNFACRSLRLKNSPLRTEIANLAGHYSLANGDATLQDFRASLLGGEITAQGTMKQIGGNSHSDVNAAVHGVSLAELEHSFATTAPLNNVAVSGALNANAKASWGKTFDDLVAQADATINGAVASKQVPESLIKGTAPASSNESSTAPSAIPVESAIHATFAAKGRQLALNQSYLRTPQTDLTMNGSVGTHSSLQLNLRAADLREVEKIADLFLPQATNQSLKQLQLAGAASFQGTVQGSTVAPHLTGQLAASNLQFNGTAWRDFHTNVDVSPSLASLQHAVLEPAAHGRIAFSASAGLSQWSFSNTSPIQIELQASQLDIANLSMLANQQIPVNGTLNAALTLHGNELNPVGQGSVTLTNITAYEEPIPSAKLVFSGDGQSDRGELSIQLPSGSIHGKGTVQPGKRTYTAELTASGIQLEKQQALKSRNLDLSGTLSLNAKSQGAFDNPQLDATLQVPKLVAQSQTVSGINLHMNVADHIANATLTSSAVNTSIQAKAKINLTGDYLTDAWLDTQAIPFEPLLAVYAPDQAADVTGETEIHATLHGPLKRKDLLEAHVAIPVFKATYGNNIQLAAASPIRVDYKNGIVNVQRSSIHGTDTDLQFQGTIPIAGNGPMSLVLLGTVNLQLAPLFDPDVRSSGEVRFNIDSHGPVDAAEIGGQINIVDVNFASAGSPVGMQHGNGVLKLTKNRLNIESFQATVGGGTLHAQGGFAFRPAVRFDVGLTANEVRILYPEGMRESVDANLRLAGSPDNAILGGSVNLSDLSFTSGFDLNSFISQFSGGVAAPPTQGLAQNMQLNIALRSTNNVNLVSRTLSIGGSANLQVRGSAAEPVILGRVNLNNGDIILNGNRYILNAGTIQFINPYETQPVVNLALTTSIQQYNINLRFQGPVDQMRTEYSSDPALPSADIINLLAFGETTEASAANATPANQAAESLVASQVSSQLTSRISKVAGISQLSISPVLAGSNSQGPPGATITIQQRVTGNLFVNFSTNVASTQSQTIQGEYRVSPRVSVSATRDPNGGFAVDTLIKKSW